jgi:hypothetical protein
VFLAINDSANGDTKLVSGQSGRKIRVTSYLLLASAAVTAKFRSGPDSGATSDLTGPMALGANLPVALPVAPPLPNEIAGYFETQPGEDLWLNLGGAVQVSGHLSYELVS